MILIIDFGSQTTHLISRRLKEHGISTKIVSPDQLPDLSSYQGIILSGGPSSVYEPGSPQLH